MLLISHDIPVAPKNKWDVMDTIWDVYKYIYIYILMGECAAIDDTPFMFIQVGWHHEAVRSLEFEMFEVDKHTNSAIEIYGLPLEIT